MKTKLSIYISYLLFGILILNTAELFSQDFNGKTFYISSAATERILTYNPNGIENGTVCLYDNGREINQQWKLEAYGNGVYTITAVKADKCLDADLKNLGVTRNISIKPCGDGENQKWKISPSANGMFSIKNMDGDRFLTADAATIANNSSKVTLLDNQSTPNQLWSFKEIVQKVKPTPDPVFTMPASLPDAANYKQINVKLNNSGIDKIYVNPYDPPAIAADPGFMNPNYVYKPEDRPKAHYHFALNKKGELFLAEMTQLKDTNGLFEKLAKNINPFAPCAVNGVKKIIDLENSIDGKIYAINELGNLVVATFDPWDFNLKALNFTVWNKGKYIDITCGNLRSGKGKVLWFITDEYDIYSWGVNSNEWFKTPDLKFRKIVASNLVSLFAIDLKNNIHYYDGYSERWSQIGIDSRDICIDGRGETVYSISATTNKLTLCDNFSNQRFDNELHSRDATFLRFLTERVPIKVENANGDLFVR